jgi:hypothetical protein
MSLDPLVEIIESRTQQDWTARNQTAFDGVFGTPSGRYPKAAADQVTLRAPEMNQDTGVPFAAYIGRQLP